MIYRTTVSYRAQPSDQPDEYLVFIDERKGIDHAAMRLVKLLTTVLEFPESTITFAGPFDEDYWRERALRPDAGDQFLLEIDSKTDEPVYCRDPLLLVGPRSMTRLRAALAAIQRPPTAEELEQPAGAYKTERRFEIEGETWVIPPYLAKHRPANQLLVEGIPVNPNLRWGFDWPKSNSLRDPQELQDWWKRPYIVIDTWEEREDRERYRRACELEEGIGCPEWPALESQEESEAEWQRRLAAANEVFDWDMSIRRAHWYSHFPEGVRYTVKCLGAEWNTCTGHAASLSDAVKIARGGAQELVEMYHELTLHIPEDLNYLNW